MSEIKKSLRSTYYTPRTYGIEGLTYNGFDIDEIFVAGSNVNDESLVPKNTFELLLFHLKRSFLSALHSAIEYRLIGTQKVVPSNTKGITVPVSELSDPADLANIIATPDIPPATLTAPSGFMVVMLYLYSILKALTESILSLMTKSGFIKSKSPLHLFSQEKLANKTAFMGSSVAKSVTVVLTSHPYVAPPPPLHPDEVYSEEESARTHIKANDEEIAMIKEEITKHEESKSAHIASDYKRLIVDASELVYFSAAASLERLTIYEATGVFSQSPQMLAKMVKSKFEASSIGSTQSIPSIHFVYPSKRLRVDLIDGQISVIDLNSIPTRGQEDEDSTDNWNRILEVVVLEKNDGQLFLSVVLRKVCVMVSKGQLRSDEVEKTLDRIFKEAYIAPGADLVITSGYTCELQGLSPLNVRGSFF